MLLETIKMWMLLLVISATGILAQMEDAAKELDNGEYASGWFWVMLVIVAIFAALWWATRSVGTRGGRGGPQQTHP